MSPEEMFEAARDEYLKFELIPESHRRHVRPDLCAFLYLDKRFPGTSDMISGASHDEYWLSIESEQIATLTLDDVVYLRRCGVRYDEDSLAMFT